MYENKKIGCIIVLYNPNWEVTHKVLESIYKQVDRIFMVDNSPNAQEVDFSVYGNVVYHFIGGNKGIATAQNIGIKYFEQNDYDFVIFFDQDSIPSINLVEHLYTKYKFLSDKGIKIGGIGPRPYNRTEGKEYRGMIKKGKKLYPYITEVTDIISSASFIPINNFSIVGYMEERLFIDAVDHEWCWRAIKKAKLRFFIIEDILLSHQLGEGDRFFLFRKVAIPTPFRTYYQFRNYFLLVRRGYVPLYWKVKNAIKYFVKYFYFSIFVPPKKQYFLQINRGIIDGLKNKIR